MPSKSPKLTFTSRPKTAREANRLPLTIKKQRKDPVKRPDTFEMVPKTLPKPYKQGSLDGLCGLYAIINALRAACSSAGINRRISWRGLFRTMLGVLDTRGLAFEVTTMGIEKPVHDSCIRIARRYLRMKHDIRLIVTRPWAGRKRLGLTGAFQQVGRFLDQPGTAAMLSFAATTDSHWTVMHTIDKEVLHLADSAGYRSLAMSRFRFARVCNYHPAKGFLVGPTCLVLFKVVPKRNSRWWDLSEAQLSAE